MRLHAAARARGWPRIARIARAVGSPAVALDAALGREDFRFPATAGILRHAGDFDVVQLHNLHGAYFDLRRLPALAERAPVVLTPHDMWLATGHCAHSLGCERWLTGCGSCPHLRVYPALLRDGTSSNLRRKREIYRRASLRIGVPCSWLASVVERSILSDAIAEVRVIPNGVDLTVYGPGDRGAARGRLGLEEDAIVIVYAAQGARKNGFKDFPVLEAALRHLSSTAGQKIVAFALGAEMETTSVRGRVELRSVAPVPPERVVDHLQAADIYVHPARAETFPLAVLEALACGVPVVASAVGGISEQLTPETGVLVPSASPSALADALDSLASDSARRAEMGKAAAGDARSRFDVSRQAGAYLEWFGEISEDGRRRSAV